MSSNHYHNNDFDIGSISSRENGGVTASTPKNGLTRFLENRLVQWAFVLSCVAMSAAVVKPSVISFVGNAFVFAVVYYITFCRKILEQIFREINGKMVAVTVVFTLIAVGFIIRVFFEKIIVENSDIPAKFGSTIGIPASSFDLFFSAVLYCIYLVTAPAIFVFLYAYLTFFLGFFVRLFQTSDKPERVFFITAFLVAAVSVSVTYYHTTAFSEPRWFLTEENRVILPDAEVVYTFDSGIHYRHYFLNCPPMTILHRPLLSLFFLPFSATLWVGLIPLSFLNNTLSLFIASSFICIIQLPLLIIHPVLLSRLVGVKGSSKTIFLILFALSYPALLFALTLEGYILITFFTSVLIYFLSTEKPDHWNTSFAYTAATGSLLSTGVLILFFVRLKSMKDDARNIFRALFVFLAFLLFYDAGFLKGFTSIQDYQSYSKYTGISFSLCDKVLQFINFTASCFVKPETIIAPPFLAEVGPWMNYQLAPVESPNLFGLILLAFCLIGFLLNFKHKFAQICVFWIAFSFFVMCLVGWGTAENGLILYALYFGWAYFCLVFLAIEKLMQKLPAAKYTVFVALIVIFAWINLPGIYDLIQFGIKHYPVQ